MATFAGGKFTGSHTTAIEPAVPLLKVLGKSDLVTKIALGFIKNKAKKAKGQAKYKIHEHKNGSSGIKLVVNGPGTVQEIHVYTNNRAAVEALIEETWTSKGKGEKKKRIKKKKR